MSILPCGPQETVMAVLPPIQGSPSPSTRAVRASDSRVTKTPREERGSASLSPVEPSGQAHEMSFSPVLLLLLSLTLPHCCWERWNPLGRQVPGRQVTRCSHQRTVLGDCRKTSHLGEKRSHGAFGAGRGSPAGDSCRHAHQGQRPEQSRTGHIKSPDGCPSEVPCR